jgi:hypothetical protein
LQGTSNTKRKSKYGPTEGFEFLIGRNVLIDYYIYRECIEASYIFWDAVLEVFEGGPRGHGEGIGLKGLL